MLGRSIQYLAEAGQEKRCMEFVGFAACCIEELDRGIEGQNDFERARAFFSNLAMNRAHRVFARFECPTREKETRLFGDTCHLELCVQDDRICRSAPLVGMLVLPVAKASNDRHP
jgi:hypothetical protein